MRKSINPYFQRTKAHINFIKDYRPNFFDIETNQSKQIHSIYCSRFPSIIKSDNTVWHLSSIYFNYLLIYDKKSTALLESISSDLVDFLRFLEENELDILYLPPNREKRITYQYHTSLLQRIRLGVISPSTARQRMNRILRFYDFLFSQNIFNEAELKNRPYEKLKTYVTCISNSGDIYKKQIESTNLRIRYSQRPFYGDEIVDGRRLHPLNEEEKKIFLRYVDSYAERDFQLICYLALYTGARIQTICTIRENHIKNIIYNQKVNIIDNSYSLRIGGKSLIDTKGSYEQNLKIPKWLVDEINQYLLSESWKKRATKSYYYNSGENYIFLTKYGNPYYTSFKEIEDRKLQNINSNKKFSMQKGNSTRQALSRIIIKMKKNKEIIRPFSIHDLRATFGINLLLEATKHVNNVDQIIPYIQNRMGHRNIMTTLHYIKYISFSEISSQIDGKFSEILSKYE